MSKQILVTGGAGFIGSNFVRLLLETTDWYVTNIDALTYAAHPTIVSEWSNRKNYRFMKIDIADIEQLEKAFDVTYDVVINFAAETHVDRSIEDANAFVRSNVIGVSHLLHLVKQGKAKKYIQISTDEVYGSLTSKKKPFKETSKLSPNNPYSATKASADLLVQSFYRTYDLPVIITRCSNNYGPYQNKEKLIPKIIEHISLNKKIPIYGDGLNIREWLYVEDHCRAIKKVMLSGEVGEVYNIGCHQERTNLEVVHFILNYMGGKEELIELVKDRQGHDFRYALNYSKLSKLGWMPLVSFEEGMSKTIDWYVQG
ncbi:dTDP-glucose 4,6-dehydratase [Bacillus hwajinpoensis]|uniref:dTDP-glucose 4,6-dehydratase n=1 Tax=Guptibacillus hwajinpoensis TaxID=208199 RepID=A0A845EYG5_9BACL|nr:MULTISPECIES: dTDP-glucose 4,6-dehydratase [Bacillaceae]MYL63565.1 dTDP-glucose 4,6-dehydratase [Pseudalkalibacillus hwajinpoensis]PFG12746.1 dTDP-glucose 4,6-dehydratase [Bacillus sp. es.036]